jgi:hypothetical protein
MNPDPMLCPDCFGVVEQSLLHDPAGAAAPVPIWDCSRCQHTGFVDTAPDRMDQPWRTSVN